MNDTISPQATADTDNLRAAMTSDLRQPAAFERFLSLYSPEVEFADPLQELHGREAFERSMRRMIGRAKELRFEVGQTAQQGNQVFLTWVMTFVPKPIGPTLRFEGTTHCVVREGKIIAQRDYFDLLSGVMNALPLARTAYRTAAGLFA